MKDADKVTENLYRVAEFRRWVQTNALFPHVSDNIVNPMVDWVRNAENALVAALYAGGEVERVVAIEQQLKPAPRTPVL